MGLPEGWRWLAIYCSDEEKNGIYRSCLPGPWRFEERTVAFVDVNVVPMDNERVLERQTLIVRDGRIAVMGEVDSIEVPKEALRVDGRGRYLMPGLVDMHAHLYTPQEFPLYLAHGVTTVFNLWGRPAHLNWRGRIERGEILGPTIYTCGPIVFRADTADEARRIVEAQSQAGYDSIKIYNDVSKEAYPVLIEMARRNRMLVVGHIPRSVGLEGVLDGHQAIAHVEEYVWTLGTGFTVNDYTSLFGWTDPQMTMAPGEGAVLYLPGTIGS